MSMRSSANRIGLALQRSRSGPNGQPPESSHLAAALRVAPSQYVAVHVCAGNHPGSRHIADDRRLLNGCPVHEADDEVASCVVP